jgi:hypothetical protein
MIIIKLSVFRENGTVFLGEHYAHEEIHDKANATGASSPIYVASLYSFTLSKCLLNLRLPSGIFFDIKLLLSDFGSLLIKLTT